MSASTVDRTAANSPAFSFIRYPMKAAKAVFKNCAVMIVAGYAQLAFDTSGGRFVGMARSAADNTASGAADGDVYVEVHPCNGSERYQEFAATSPAIATWLGKKVEFVDDNTVALTGSTTNHVVAGVVVQVKTATVIVDTMPALAAQS